jgi:serine/threonine-protein phosphatase 6 regulatory subunit 3
LSDEKLITALIDKFDPKYSAEIHENASQTLVDIITLSHTLGGSPLVEQLESEVVMSKLFTYILDSDTSSSRSTLMYGLSVAIEVLKREPNEDHDSASTVEDLPAFLRVMVSHLDKFVELVKTTEDMPKVKLTYGEITPVGTHRLKVLEFFCGLHGRKYTCIDDLLLKFGILSTCLDLFFAYHWNNFLHIIIQDILMAIFDGQNQDLVLSLVSECNLASRICKVVEEDLMESAEPRGIHRGYMGFVTNISNKLIEVSEGAPSLADLLDKCDGWSGYVEGALKNTNEVQNLVLGGAKPSMNDEGESSDNDIQGHSDLVNVFTQYLVNQGFSDFPKDFADEEDDEYEDEDEEEEEEEEEGNGELALDKEFEEPGQHYSTDDVCLNSLELPFFFFFFFFFSFS